MFTAVVEVTARVICLNFKLLSTIHTTSAKLTIVKDPMSNKTFYRSRVRLVNQPEIMNQAEITNQWSLEIPIIAAPPLIHGIIIHNVLYAKGWPQTTMAHDPAQPVAATMGMQPMVLQWVSLVPRYVMHTSITMIAGDEAIHMMVERSIMRDEGKGSKYRTAGKFGWELNLAVWQSSLRPPN